MKKIKAAFLLILLPAALILASCSAFVDDVNVKTPDYSAAKSAAAAESSEPVPGKISSAPENSSAAEFFLSRYEDNIAAAYRAVYEGIFDHREEIELPEGAIRQQDFGELLSLVGSTGICGDTISPDYKMYVDDRGFVKKAAVKYLLTAEECSKRYTLVKAEAERIAEKARLLSDDYERIKFFHDELVRSCEYSSDGADSHSAYGALCAKKAVCEGYAKAFDMLCELCGIPCLPVGGSAADTDGSQQLHMWNKVQLDGKWYNVDCTWDDPVGAEQGSVRYDHFLISDKDISVTHTEDTGGMMRVPAAEDSDGSYFDRENKVLLSTDDIKARFKEQCALCIDGGIEDDTVRFCCESRALYDEVMDLLFTSPPDSDSGMVQLLQEFLTADTTISYLLTTNDDMLTINLHIIVQPPEVYG